MVRQVSVFEGAPRKGAARLSFAASGAVAVFVACSAHVPVALSEAGALSTAPGSPHAHEEAPSAPERPTHPPARTEADKKAGIRRPAVDCELTRETGYRKGEPFPIKVLSIDDDLVEKRTAAAYWAMREAAAADEVELVIFSGFRSNEEQRYFYRCFRRCNCNDCNLASKPGYSNHQTGRALDIGMLPGAHDWLSTHGRRFGFKPTVKSEPWHWEYRPGLKPDKSTWPEMCPDY